MKPTKMRNKMIHRASNSARSLQVGAALSKDLRKKYKKRSVRLTVGDSISIVRGEFAGVDGKVSKVSVEDGTIAIEGIKKEKTKGDKFDVYIHASNVLVTSLDAGDWWRIARLEGKNPKDADARKASAAEEPSDDDDYDDEQDDKKEAKPEPLVSGDSEGHKPETPSKARDELDSEEKKKEEQAKAEKKKQKDKKRTEKAKDEEYDEDYDDDVEDED